VQILAAFLLAAFGIAGLLGAWSALPPAVLLAAFAWLPGTVALAPLRRACSARGLACAVEGPGRFVFETGFSLLVLLPAVLPLLLLGTDLGAARMPMAGAYLLLGVAGLCWPGTSPARRQAGAWTAFAVAVCLLLPAVLAYAGGTVDDWWDLAFVRAYAQRVPLGLGEPMLGSGLVHPRFAWNAWLLLQALVLRFGRSDPAALQAGPLAAFVCVLSVSGVAALARAVFGRETRVAVVASIVFVPLWLYGSEALPYFTRLHQDKFVVALALVPALLAAAILWLRAPVAINLVLVLTAACAACSTHGLVFAIGCLGVVCVTLGYTFGGVAAGAGEPATAPLRTWLARLRAAAPMVAVALAPMVYPLWQARRLGDFFSAQGIALSESDNPVVRAHLALGRLLWPDAIAYVVHPGAVFGPPALIASIGLVAALRARRTPALQALIAVTLIPCVLLFTPLVAAAVGSVLVPWMLYRIGWLVPVALLAGFAFEYAWCRPRGRSRTAAVVALSALSLAVTVPTTVSRFHRGMAEHPRLREREPRGNTLASYRYLASVPGHGPVLAPAGFSELVPAITGRPVVAMSERATLVFAGDERNAYQRLYDRATFFARTTSTEARRRIVDRYGVELVVFRRRLVTAGSDVDWLEHASAEGFLLSRAGEGAPLWSASREAVEQALPPGWAIDFTNEDFFIAGAGRSEHAPGAVEWPGSTRTRPRRAAESWLAAIGVDNGDAAPAGKVLASATAYPGARLTLDPVPLGLGISDKLVWIGGSELWDDGPDAIGITLELTSPCQVDGLELVPFLRTGRREAYDVRIGSLRRRVLADDGVPIFVRLPPRRTRSLSLSVRSVFGKPFGLGDVRVWGDPETCEGGWRPLARPAGPADDLALGDYMGLVSRYPRSGRAALGLARRIADAGHGADARALLRLALVEAPDSAALWVELGLLRDADGEPEGARAAFQRALVEDSNSAWARGCLAWAQARGQQPVRALYNAWRALQEDPRYADAYTILAAVAKGVGLRSWARSLLRHAVMLDPHRNWAYFELARLLAEDGHRVEAARVLLGFLKLVPDDHDARDLLLTLTHDEARKTR
jgi:Tfp pilus assembly protein PilF